jgi:diguanylate cyclase (GGDEF)-like protein
MKKILVIEDQKAMASLLKQTIEMHFNLEVLIAFSLEDTRQILAHETEIVLALSDLNLPDAPHGESIQLLREAHITTVVLTASLDEALRQRIMRERVADFIVKDGSAAINYLVRVVDLLLTNHQREIWLANLSDAVARKLIGLLTVHRFKINVFDQEAVLLKELAKRSPNLLIVGDKTTEQGWFHQLSSIRSQFEFYQLPILACIDSDQGTALALKTMKYGATDYIIQPFGADELYARVNQSIDLQRDYTKIQHLSQTDSLTGLYNRRYFMKYAEDHYQAWLNHGVFCLMVDIDFFKQINDLHGHPKGDEAIRFTAECFNKHFPKAVVARFGGEEFIAAGEFSSPQIIIEQAEDFRQSIEQQSEEKLNLKMTISLGLAFNQPQFDKLIALADQQLYLSKQAGRNCISIDSLA